MFQSQPTPFDRPPDERPLIKLVLHSDSLRQRLLTGDLHVTALFALWNFDFVELLITPTTDPEVLAYLSQHQLQCANVWRSANHWALVEPTRRRLICPVQANINYSAPVVSGSHVTWLDFFLGRHRDFDYFVVSPEDQFFYSNLRKEQDLDPQEALNRVRILAVNSGLFYVQPKTTVNEGFYYLYRFKKVFQSFQKAYTAAPFSERVPVDACKQFDSLAQRLELICRAADHASHFALRRADNDNQDRALCHTAFLIMLITGAFDDLAWLIAHMYSIKVDRQKVSLRKQPKGANRQFFAAFDSTNSSLKEFLFLPKTQTQLNLFYPIRNKLQHGVFLEPIHFVLEQSNKNLLIIL